MEQFDLRAILVMIGVLTVITGLVTEVLKQITQKSIPSSLLAIIVAQVLTLLPGFLYSLLAKTTILWYHVFAAMVAAYGVACSAMFTYDKIQEIRASFDELKSHGGKK